MDYLAEHPVTHNQHHLTDYLFSLFSGEDICILGSLLMFFSRLIFNACKGLKHHKYK